VTLNLSATGTSERGFRSKPINLTMPACCAMVSVLLLTSKAFWAR
jgi:hypothetical protein